MVILVVLTLFSLSILSVGEPPEQQQQRKSQQQSQLLSLTNILPAEATSKAAPNNTNSNATTSGENITQLSTNDNTTSSSLPGLRIAYPRGWLYNDQGNGTVTFSTPLRTDLMRFTVNVVNIPASLQQNLTLDRLVDINLNSLKQQLSNFTLFESNKTTISATENQTAHKIVYTNTNKNPNFPLGFKSMQIFAVKDGQAYTISYVSEESQYLKYLPVIERMIDSISFANRR